MKKMTLLASMLLLMLASATFAAEPTPGLDIGASAEIVDSSETMPSLTEEGVLDTALTDDCETNNFVEPAFLQELKPQSSWGTNTCGSCSGICANRSVGAPCSVLAGNGSCLPKFLEDIMCPQGDGLWCACD